jgi:hypothetical protein
VLRAAHPEGHALAGNARSKNTGAGVSLWDGKAVGQAPATGWAGVGTARADRHVLVTRQPRATWGLHPASSVAWKRTIAKSATRFVRLCRVVQARARLAAALPSMNLSAPSWLRSERASRWSSVFHS